MPDPGSDAIVTTRDLDYPPETVFGMWTDAENLATWWGPAGCITTRCEVDATPGGTMRIDQGFPGEDVHPMTATFEEVEPPERLVLRIPSPDVEGFSPWVAVHTVTFEEIEPGRTRLTAATRVVSGPEEEREALAAAYRQGWSESLGKLRDALG